MKLRYFCDLCGTEVPRNTVRCPTCGRYFTAIQCPRCGFRGEEKDFAQGCPKCGYMKISRPSGSTGDRRATRSARRSVRSARSADRNRSKRATTDGAGRSPVSQEPSAPPAPVGVYRLIGVLLALILIALVVILFLR
jgi:predicted RNA-binding Zn-ribbon protein involved in translation (DUF1610 family)